MFGFKFARGLAAGLVASALALSSGFAQASTTTITFKDLPGGDGTSFSSYYESGYAVFSIFGDWYDLASGGNAQPSIFSITPPASGLFGDYGLSALLVSAGGPTFSFDSMDLAPLSEPMAYAFIGSLAGTPQYFNVGFAAPGSFSTIASPSGAQIDALAVLFLAPPGSVYVVDNITVTAVPEPSSMAAMGLGVAGLGLLARRRRTVR